MENNYYVKKTGSAMKKYIPYIGIFILLISAWSCVDEVNLNVDTEQRSVVVNGFVTDSLGDFIVKLSESSVIGIGNDNILTPIMGATVNLMDTDGDSYPYQVIDEGVYQLTNFKAIRGKTYFIDIVLSDGRHYISKPTSLRSSSKIDDVSFDVEEVIYRNNVGELITENRVTTKISTDVSSAEEPPFLRWRVEGEYQLQEAYPMALNPLRCYVKVNLDLNDIRIFDASEIAGDVLYEQVIAETEYDFRFAEQFCIHILQFSISEEEYEYWRSVRELIDIDGSLFDPPPGTVVGNIINVDDPNDVPVGFFSVASVSLHRQFVNRDDTGIFVRDKCSGFRFSIPFACDDCLKLNNSTLTRPPYWEF